MNIESLNDLWHVINKTPKPNCLLVSDEFAHLHKVFSDHYQKWSIDLFSPKGLSIIFNRGNHHGIY